MLTRHFCKQSQRVLALCIPTRLETGRQIARTTSLLRDSRTSHRDSQHHSIPSPHGYLPFERYHHHVAKRIIALTTDFGTSDHFAGTMKGVILRIAPNAAIGDISHYVQSFAAPDGAFT